MSPNRPLRRSLRRPIAPAFLTFAFGLTAVLGPGCVGYRPLAVSAGAADAESRAIHETGLTFDDAVRRLVERNPDLLALRAEAAAVNLRPGPDPLEISQEIRDGRATDFLIGTDVLALFGLTRTGAERALARAQRDAVWMRHHERARELVGNLAEAYAVERVLRHTFTPKPETFVDAFKAAGLVSEADVAAAKAAHAQAVAEDEVVAAELADARRQIANLVGAAPESIVVPAEPEASWPPVPDPAARDLLYARGDLQRLLAEYETADRELRLAVAEQAPNLAIHLGADLDLKDPLQWFSISLPLAAPAKARAAACAREAARRRFIAGVHAARHDAAAARLTWDAAQASWRAADRSFAATEALVRATKARLQVDADAITEVLLVADQAVSVSRDLREAGVASAAARVKAAVAAGWPGPEFLGCAR